MTPSCFIENAFFFKHYSICLQRVAHSQTEIVAGLQPVMNPIYFSPAKIVVGSVAKIVA